MLVSSVPRCETPMRLGETEKRLPLHALLHFRVGSIWILGLLSQFYTYNINRSSLFGIKLIKSYKFDPALIWFFRSLSLSLLTMALPTFIIPFLAYLAIRLVFRLVLPSVHPEKRCESAITSRRVGDAERFGFYRSHPWMLIGIGSLVLYNMQVCNHAYLTY